MTTIAPSREVWRYALTVGRQSVYGCGDWVTTNGRLNQIFRILFGLPLNLTYFFLYYEHPGRPFRASQVCVACISSLAGDRSVDADHRCHISLKSHRHTQKKIPLKVMLFFLSKRLCTFMRRRLDKLPYRFGTTRAYSGLFILIFKVARRACVLVFVSA